MSMRLLTKLRFHLWCSLVGLTSLSALAAGIGPTEELNTGWFVGSLLSAIGVLGSLLIWSYKQEMKKTEAQQKIIDTNLRMVVDGFKEVHQEIQALTVELRRLGMKGYSLTQVRKGDRDEN